MEGSDFEMEGIDFLGYYGTIEVLEYIGDHQKGFSQFHSAVLFTSVVK